MVSRFKFVADKILTSTGIEVLLPTGVMVLASTACNNLGWSSRGRSPISSRNKMPLSAFTNAPVLSCNAPVKAPFLCPNNSLSISSLGMAAQLTFIKGPLFSFDTL